MIDELIRLYPRLYHMAFAEGLEAIQRYGLLSTKELISLCGLPNAQALEVLRSRRAKALQLAGPLGEEIVIRDQGPISESKLAGCLQGGMTPADWYDRLNERVYFWVKETRVRGLLTAGAYANGRHAVLVFDTARLLKDHADNVELAPMNTGATRPMAFARGPNTFQKIGDYPFKERLERRLEPIVEFTVLGGVRNAFDYLIMIEHWDDGQLVDIVQM